MKRSLASENCGACGNEYTINSLSPIRLFNWRLNVCASCFNKQPEQNFTESYKTLKKLNGDL